MFQEKKKSVTIADAPKVENICNLPPQGEFIGPTLPAYRNALPSRKSTPLPQAPDSHAPTPLVYSEEPVRGPVLQSQRAPMPMRSPHISSTAPLARSSPATPESGAITGHRSFQASPAMNSAIPALQVCPLPARIDGRIFLARCYVFCMLFVSHFRRDNLPWCCSRAHYQPFQATRSRLQSQISTPSGLKRVRFCIDPSKMIAAAPGNLVKNILQVSVFSCKIPIHYSKIIHTDEISQTFSSQ